MVRALAGSALLLSALGWVGVNLVPSLSATPGGQAMVVQEASVPGLYDATFDAAECFPATIIVLDSAGEVLATTPAGEPILEDLDTITATLCPGETDGEPGLI